MQRLLILSALFIVFGLSCGCNEHTVGPKANEPTDNEYEKPRLDIVSPDATSRQPAGSLRSDVQVEVITYRGMSRKIGRLLDGTRYTVRFNGELQIADLYEMDFFENYTPNETVVRFVTLLTTKQITRLQGLLKQYAFDSFPGVLPSLSDRELIAYPRLGQDTYARLLPDDEFSVIKDYPQGNDGIYPDDYPEFRSKLMELFDEFEQ